MPKIRKHTSKRVTLKKKYSIQKKVKDSKKKMKKEAKKLKGMGIVPRSKGSCIDSYRDEESGGHSQHLPL